MGFFNLGLELNVYRLQKAAEELAANQATRDPLVPRLLKNITAISVQVPGSFFQKLQLRAEIRGLLVPGRDTCILVNNQSV